jgi:hypothetical protein
VSCKIISIEEFERTIPVNPPTVNRKINPKTHNKLVDIFNLLPKNVVIHLKTLIPVGTAITIVAEVKYARESISKPTVNI